MQFPIKFLVDATAEEKIATTWQAKADDLPPITSCIPREFGGPSNGYSPEDLFALSIVNCIIATLKVYAEKSQVSFKSLSAQAELTMDKHTSDNYLFMSHIDIRIQITGASDKSKLENILERSIKDCAISNSVKTGKTYQIDIK